MAATSMAIPYDEQLERAPQSDGFTQHAEWDFEHPGRALPAVAARRTSRSTASRWSSRPISCWPCTSAATPSGAAAKARTSPTTRPARCATRRCRYAQAIIAAEVGHLQLALDYWAETAFTDLADIHDNTADGLHIITLAAPGRWRWPGSAACGTTAAADVLPASPGLSRLRFLNRRGGACR
ncbi:MAG: hypothetical protein R2755_19135 [Acidimicrobiales bacterium]